MPVLSEPHHGLAHLPGLTTSYVFLGAVILLCIGVIISRKSKPQSSPNSQNTNMSASSPEKDISDIKSESQSAPTPIDPAKPRIFSRPPQALPFIPPMLDQEAEMNSEMSFSSFEAYEPALDMPPRRRSYTKTTGAGTEVSGEIIVAEGWRRHTRVFGGGVCKACEESERRMSA